MANTKQLVPYVIVSLLKDFSCCSVAQSCPALCHSMDCSPPGLPVLHYHLEFIKIHVHGIGDTI